MIDPTDDRVGLNGAVEGSVDGSEGGDGNTMKALAIASVALSGLGFLTLLKLTDRQDRTPARALFLFFATTLESTAGTALGIVAASCRRFGAARQGAHSRSYGRGARYRHDPVEFQLDEDEASPLAGPARSRAAA